MFCAFPLNSVKSVSTPTHRLTYSKQELSMNPPIHLLLQAHPQRAQSNQFDPCKITPRIGVITFAFSLINLMQVCLKTGRKSTGSGLTVIQLAETSS